MTIDEYQEIAHTTAVYPLTYVKTPEGNMVEFPLDYTTLGLAGEAGEVAGKVKKLIRDDFGRILPEKRDALVDELGDVLWYLSETANVLNMKMSELAQMNLNKLLDRKSRGVIQGEGDNR